MLAYIVIIPGGEWQASEGLQALLRSSGEVTELGTTGAMHLHSGQEKPQVPKSAHTLRPEHLSTPRRDKQTIPVYRCSLRETAAGSHGACQGRWCWHGTKTTKLVFTPGVPTPHASSPSCAYEMVCSTLAHDSSPFSVNPCSRASTSAAGRQRADGCGEDVESAAKKQREELTHTSI